MLTSCSDGSSSPLVSRTAGNLENPDATRRLHADPGCLRVAEGTPARGGRARERARAERLQLPRLDSAQRRPGRRRALRRRARNGAARGRGRRRFRRGVRRASEASRGRAHSGWSLARPGSRRGARSRARTDAPLRALRRLRPAHPRPPLHRLDLDRPVRALGRGDSGSGGGRCRRAPASRSAHRGLGRGGELLGGAERRPRVPALHAPRRLPRVAGSRDPPLGRPRPHRLLAPGAWCGACT